MGLTMEWKWERLFHHVVAFKGTHVDLMVIHLSCSSLRVSVKRVSPARAFAMIPAFDTRESVNVDLPWSTWAMTDMFLMFFFLSIIPRISSTVKFTWTKPKLCQHHDSHNTDVPTLVIVTRTLHFPNPPHVYRSTQLSTIYTTVWPLVHITNTSIFHCITLKTSSDHKDDRREKSKFYLSNLQVIRKINPV